MSNAHSNETFEAAAGATDTELAKRHFVAKFCYGKSLSREEIKFGQNHNLLFVNGDGWSLTEYGRTYLPLHSHPPTIAMFADDSDHSQCADDDSYLPPVRAERDPNGKHQHETGAKLDAGKPRLGLVLGAFANALVEVGKVGTYGVQKYTDNGWLDVPNGKARYTDALLRHILAETNESHDPDTNLHHAAHAAWNALARLELILRKREVNQ